MNHISCDKRACAEADECAIQRCTDGELQHSHIVVSNGHGDVEKKIPSCATANESRECLTSKLQAIEYLITDLKYSSVTFSE